MNPLPRDFYARDTQLVARGLLGCVLETKVGGRLTSGRIVEVEAYIGPDDPAAHGYRARRTQRNEALFGPPGTSYVYFIYGMYWCVNAVAETVGYPAAVLIRALEPMSGVSLMERRRGVAKRRDLCSGPGKLCQALGITGLMNARFLDGKQLRIVGPPPGTGEPVEIESTARIGISRAVDWPLRFVEAGSYWLSRPA